MLARVMSCAIKGLDGVPVSVEVDIAGVVARVAVAPSRGKVVHLAPRVERRYLEKSHGRQPKVAEV